MKLVRIRAHLVAILLACAFAHCQNLPDAPSTYLLSTFSPASGAMQAGSRTPDVSTRPASQNWLARAFDRAATDQKEIYSAPFHGANLKWDALFVAGTAGLIAADKHASRSLPTTHLEISRRISDAGLIGTAATVGGLWTSGIFAHDPHAREAGTLGFEAWANTAAVYAVTQLVAGRERPVQGTGEGRFFQNHGLNTSFFSGHSSFTWSMATVVAHEYPRPLVKWLAYGAATTVSITRFTGRKHFPADVAVGGAIGYLIGRHIFHSHCKAGLSSACRAEQR